MHEDEASTAKHNRLVIERLSTTHEIVKPMTVRLPVSKIAAIDKTASSQGRTRTEVVKDAIDAYLMQCAV